MKGSSTKVKSKDIRSYFRAFSTSTSSQKLSSVGAGFEQSSCKKQSNDNVSTLSKRKVDDTRKNVVDSKPPPDQLSNKKQKLDGTSRQKNNSLTTLSSKRQAKTDTASSSSSSKNKSKKLESGQEKSTLQRQKSMDLMVYLSSSDEEIVQVKRKKEFSSPKISTRIPNDCQKAKTSTSSSSSSISILKADKTDELCHVNNHTSTPTDSAIEKAIHSDKRETQPPSSPLQSISRNLGKIAPDITCLTPEKLTKNKCPSDDFHDFDSDLDTPPKARAKKAEAVKENNVKMKLKLPSYHSSLKKMNMEGTGTTQNSLQLDEADKKLLALVADMELLEKGEPGSEL